MKQTKLDRMKQKRDEMKQDLDILTKAIEILEREPDWAILMEAMSH